MYNLVFTGLPPLLLAVYDREFDAAWALRFPKLYDFGRLARGLTTATFLLWCGDALVLAGAFFVATAFGFVVPDGPSLPGAGGSPYVFSLGTVAFSMVIAAASVRVASESFQHAWFVQAAIAISALLWFPACFVFDALRQDGMAGGIAYLFGSGSYWLALLLGVGFMGGRLAAWKAWKRLYNPELRHIVSEVAAFRADARSVEAFTEAADLARRTGKPLADVLKADRVAAAAAAVLAPLAATMAAGGAAGAPAADATAYLSESPVRPPRAAGVADYSTLSSGDTPGEDMSRKLLAPGTSFGAGASASVSASGGGAAAADEAAVAATRLAILEGALLPARLQAPGRAGGADDFDVERASDTAATPREMSPVAAATGGAGARDLGEAVAIADMKARLDAGVRRLQSGVGSVDGRWPPGSEPRWGGP